MPRHKKKAAPVLHPSPGPLPARLAGRFADRLLVFSDASQRRQGGLAAVLFASLEPEAEPLVSTRSVPLAGSNELELQAALFALQQAHSAFPGQALALFTDNRDAADRLDRARRLGLAQDPALAGMLRALALPADLGQAEICWVKSHATCRGNLLADRYAALAAA